MLTYKQVLAQRQTKYAQDAARAAKQAERESKFKVQENLHPAIGALMSAAGVRYYAYINGVYKEGPVAHLTALLGVSA